MHFRSVFKAVLLALLFPAFSGNVLADDASSANFEDRFKSGGIDQSCSISCMFKWGMARAELKKLDDEANWKLLAERTAEVRYGHELAYYFLAKSALNLGYKDAALIYIEKSKDKVIPCLPTTCFGINVSEEFAIFKQQIAESNPVSASNAISKTNESLSHAVVNDIKPASQSLQRTESVQTPEKEASSNSVSRNNVENTSATPDKNKSSTSKSNNQIQTLLSTVESTDQMPPELLSAWSEAPEDGANRVLNEMEAGSIALSNGYFTHAEVLFDDAQKQIETIYANNSTAQAARSKFVAEATKDFKGDPYERAMIGYYLGLIDLAKGDYDNARAGFRFAQLQDTMSTSEIYQDDMAVMQYLIGWSYWCEGNASNAKDEFDRVLTMRPNLTPPKKKDNVLMIGELGNAPVKYTSGKYSELLKYRAGGATPRVQVAFRLGDKQLSGKLAEDVFFQASTRGGTVVEDIRAGKANFKQGAETVENVASGVGSAAFTAAAMSHNNNDRNAALIVGAISLLTKLAASKVAKSTMTTADTRSWTSLPASIFLTTGKLAEPNSVEAGFFDADGKVLKTKTAIVKTSPKKECSLVYVRDKNLNAQIDSSSFSNWKLIPEAERVSSSAFSEVKAATSNTAMQNTDGSMGGTILFNGTSGN
jgi:tetratricopeptide (TPR) repeat protein